MDIPGFVYTKCTEYSIGTSLYLKEVNIREKVKMVLIEMSRFSLLKNEDFLGH